MRRLSAANLLDELFADWKYAGWPSESLGPGNDSDLNAGAFEGKFG
jgi:hypothetical protein